MIEPTHHSTCAIFDFGNVIATFDHGIACRQLSQLSNYVVSESTVRRVIFMSGLEARFDRGEFSAPAFIASLRRDLHISASDDEVARAWSDMFSPNVAIYETIRHIKAAQGRLVLASNTNELHYREISRRFGEILDLFDEQVLSFRIGAAKPDLRFFDACLNARRGALRCVYLDDREDFVEAARSHGFEALVYSGGPGVEVLDALGLD